LTSISVRGRPPVLAKQSVVPVQLSTVTGGQFEAGVNNHSHDEPKDTALVTVNARGEIFVGQSIEGVAVDGTSDDHLVAFVDRLRLG